MHRSKVCDSAGKSPFPISLSFPLLHQEETRPPYTYEGKVILALRRCIINIGCFHSLYPHPQNHKSNLVNCTHKGKELHKSTEPSSHSIDFPIRQSVPISPQLQIAPRKNGKKSLQKRQKTWNTPIVDYYDYIHAM